MKHFMEMTYETITQYFCLTLKITISSKDFLTKGKSILILIQHIFHLVKENCALSINIYTLLTSP